MTVCCSRVWGPLAYISAWLLTDWTLLHGFCWEHTMDKNSHFILSGSFKYKVMEFFMTPTSLPALGNLSYIMWRSNVPVHTQVEKLCGEDSRGITGPNFSTDCELRERAWEPNLKMEATCANGINGWWAIASREQCAWGIPTDLSQ